MTSSQEQSSHKIIESPWTKRKYVIRELDPAILSVFSKPETPEVKALRLKIQETLEDISDESKRQEKLGEKDQSKLDAIQEQLNKRYDELNKLARLDEREIENRKKIIEYGLVQPKVKSDDDFLDLGKDATFLYSNIIILSQVPDDYGEVIQALFRQAQSSGTKGDKSG